MKKLITLLSLTVISGFVFSKTITVTSSADSGVGTLRQAVLNADSTSIDEIVFIDSITTITLINQIDIDKNLTITGNDENNTILIRNGKGKDNKRHLNIISGTHVILSNLTLQDNYVNCDGGAIVNKGKLTLNKCVLKNNKAVYSSGAISSEGVLFANKCEFIGNYSTNPGGAVSATEIHLDSCIFRKNSSGGGGVALRIGGAVSTIKNCVFEENTGYLAAITNYGETTITNCRFNRNNTIYPPTAIDNYNKIIVNNSSFVGNIGDNAIFANTASQSKATIINCNFSKNTLTRFPDIGLYDSGILRNARTGTLRIINSTIANNIGVGLACDIDPYFNKCFDSIYLYNNVFYNNITANGDKYDIYLDNISSLTSNTQGMLSNSFNNIIGTTNLPFNTTTNFLNVDPLFVDTANNDFSLQEFSPAIDAGSNNFYSYSSYPKDILGNYRIDNSKIDIGAYEYQSGNPPTLIRNSNNNQLKIYTIDKNIIIGNTTKQVGIYDLQGVCISSGLGSLFTVPSSGIYIVRVENQVQKVIVR